MRMIVVPDARERADDLVQLARLARAQRRGRLVHDDQLRVARERAQDLDLLLLGRPQPAGRHVAGQVEAGRARRAAAYAPRERSRRTKPPRAGLGAEEDVLGDRQLRDDDGSCAIAATPCSSASRGERNATGSPSSRIAAAVRARARRRRSARASTCPRRSRRRARAPSRGRRRARRRRAPGRRRSAWRRPGARGRDVGSPTAMAAGC